MKQLGASLVEFGLIVALIGIAAIPAVNYIGVHSGNATCAPEVALRLNGAYDPSHFHYYKYEGQWRCIYVDNCPGVPIGGDCSRAF